MSSDLSMYLAPARVLQAQNPWLERILEILGECRLAGDSNSGMNLFRHTLAGISDRGFFSEVTFTGSHRESMRRLKEGEGDLASIDSVTYDYLARDNSDVVEVLRILGRSVRSPCLPYITAMGQTVADADSIRKAMNGFP
ncbi:PhnD/SsuA/transferrin family substrate-binding protein [Pseudomonas sp. Pseusp122]|uniref:PhnD/SsuA/transferrin family substrate-binding protein n=1 Tax=unclassified Pseudomonas TaxID=196821 RepID=UPI0039A48A2D